VLFRIDPRGYENKVRQAIGVLARAQAQESYLEAEATRRSQLPDLALSAEQRQNPAGVAQSAKDAVEEATGALDQARLDLERSTIRSSVNG
jgi:multidrug resistance efflux pump